MANIFLILHNRGITFTFRRWQLAPASDRRSVTMDYYQQNDSGLRQNEVNAHMLQETVKRHQAFRR